MSFSGPIMLPAFNRSAPKFAEPHRMTQTIIRKFLTKIGLIAIAQLAMIPLPCQASNAARTSILAVKTRDIPFYQPTLQAFLHGLDARGYSTTKDVQVTVIALSGDPDKDRRMIHDQMRKNYRLIFMLGTDATTLVADQNPTIPVLFSMLLDPVSLGIVKSYASPGGEITGTSMVVNPGKQIDMLLQVDPKVHRVGVLYTDGDPTSLAFLAQAQIEAKRLSVEIISQPVDKKISQDAMQSTVSQLAGRVDAFWLIPDPASTGAQALADTIQVANSDHLPILGASGGTVRAGALLALSANLPDLGDVTAEMASLILAGTANPAQMPVRGPRRTVLSLNIMTAKSLGITIPDAVLHLADEVIDQGAADSEGNGGAP